MAINNPNPSLLVQNLLFLMDKHKLNTTALANASKGNQPTLFRILNGETIEPRDKSLQPFANYFGVTVRQLRHFDFRNNCEIVDSNVMPSAMPQRRIPLIDWTHIHERITMPPDVSNVTQYRYSAQAFGSRAFALTVSGHSMINHGHKESFDEGDIILVDPDRKPAHGSLVIVKMPDTEKFMFKKLLFEDGKMWLMALNPNWQERIVELTDLNLVVGVVFEKQVEF